MNLRAAKKTQATVLQARKQNMVNLQSLLVKTGSTTPMNLAGRKPAQMNLVEECFNTDNNIWDSGGDSCTWYDMNSIACGTYDDNDFTASSVCCACGGGSTNVEEAVCQNTEGLERDSGGDACVWYDSNPGSCGNHDTEFFFAKKMCCACNGGSTATEAPPTICMDTNNGRTDSTGDTCSWYMTNSEHCGTFDTGFFKAKEQCCGCGGGEEQELVETAVEEFV